ncbi:MAG: hypothetical protein GY749_27090 [Desulfobacteraceae bacterium]|nr:hypothetical protein [Desulfobacteraceae bacterium]
MTQNNITNTHFLRPSLTKLVIQRLQRGDSLNLFGEIGKTRLLDDICNTGLKNTIITKVSFRGYQNNYEGFCRAICSEGRFQKISSTGLSEIIEEFQMIEGKQDFILIDDFQYLPENPDIDPAYNQQFIDNLNSIKMHPECLCWWLLRSRLIILIIFINKKINIMIHFIIKIYKNFNKCDILLFF